MDFSIWFLIGAALVFFMQAGFAMVETGFTRAKNASNIIMKNLMDFAVGTVTFTLIGYTLLCSEDYFMGIIGIPNFDIFTSYASFDYAGFVFNMVFCATTATIVSGAMAERTKFSSYLLYSIVLSAFIYPIEAGWVWNGEGFLFQMGFIDFAGSAAIHMVGGISALIGAIFLGPRIGKYVTDKETGKKVARAIPGHSITLGALGVFILWFGWYGFNGAAATSLDGIGGLGSIFLATTLAPGFAAVTTMLFTWVKNGNPDVSMSLNGALAGLVAITAGCASVDAFGSIIIGIVAGILVVVAVEFIDIKLHIDDPVGAVAVHGVNGIWGTFAVGLFAVDGGLLYGGGINLLLVQTLGIVIISIWTVITITAAFTIIKKVNGLRVSREEEILGLDTTEHGILSAYADFTITESFDDNENVTGTTPVEKAIPVMTIPSDDLPADALKFTKLSVITKQSKFEALKNALEAIGVTGMTVSQVMGHGMQKGTKEYYRGVAVESKLLPKVKVEVVICKVPVETCIKAIKRALYTGNIGDGKIFVYDVLNVVRISTGEEGYDALQDD